MATTNTRWTKSVFVKATGERTRDTFQGQFIFKTMLSHADWMEQDRVCREFLAGPAGVEPSANASSRANAFSQLRVRIVEAPAWWTEARNGLDLYDNDVVSEVVAQAMLAEEEQLKELERVAKEAEEKLRATKPLVDSEDQPAKK